MPSPVSWSVYFCLHEMNKMSAILLGNQWGIILICRPSSMVQQLKKILVLLSTELAGAAIF